MGKGRTLGLALLLISLSIVVSPACGPTTEIEEGELCAQEPCANGDCATLGHQMLRDGPRRRCRKQKKADAGAPGVAATEDVAVFPCAICARADNCCRARGQGGCAYASTCASARTA